MVYRLLLVTSVLIALASVSLWAADPHANHTSGMSHETMVSNDLMPVEGGQSAFAALIEIVALLESDPDTDWSTISIDRLRSHLLDMHYLILETEASSTRLSDTEIRFDVRGESKALAAIHHMVPTHSTFIQQSRGWSITPALNGNGATVTIQTEDPVDIEHLTALGFYGYMSLDSHHQAHHYQIVRGQLH